MKRLAIAVIHGMGSAKQFFSVELKHRITEQYVNADENRLEDDLLFHEIHWGDLVSEQHVGALDQLDYKNELAYKGVRDLFVDYLSTTLAYRSVEGSGLFEQVNQRIRDSLQKFASHRRIDQDQTPLVVLSHSFGSVLMSSYIDHVREGNGATGLSPFESFQTLAGLVTFGSPLSIYAMQGGEFSTPTNKVGSALNEDIAKRARWLNFYDKDDIVGYPLRGINEQYKAMVDGDFEINVGTATKSWNPACHDGYWEDKDFYKPVADYFAELRAPHPFWD